MGPILGRVASAWKSLPRSIRRRQQMKGMSHRGLLLAPDRCGRRQAPAASGGVHRRPVGLEPVPGCGRSAVPVRRPASRPCRPGPEPVPTTTVGWRLVDLAGCKLMYEQRRPAKAGWPPRASGAGVGSRWQDVRRGRAGRVVLWGRTSRCRWRRWSYRPWAATRAGSGAGGRCLRHRAALSGRRVPAGQDSDGAGSRGRRRGRRGGSAVGGIGPGARVAVFYYLFCRHCRWCRAGLQHLCAAFGPIRVHVRRWFAQYVTVCCGAAVCTVAEPRPEIWGSYASSRATSGPSTIGVTPGTPSKRSTTPTAC
jgi:hypothetical protein